MKGILMCGVLLAGWALAGCGASMAGVYRLEVREANLPVSQPGRTLAEVQQQAASWQETIELKADGRYLKRNERNTAEGAWRQEGETIILRADTFSGSTIASGLRDDDMYRVEAGGRTLVDEQGAFESYGFESIYVKQ